MPLILNGTGTASGNAIAASNAISINGGTGVTVRPGDLVVSLMCQQTNLTASGTTDNLGNTYTAQNAGSTSTVSGRLFYSRVTVGGVLTTVTIAATSSSNDFSCLAAAFNNAFDSSPVDANPTNTSGDVTTAFTGPATGALSQTHELIVGWSANNTNSTWAAVAPFSLAAQVSQTNTHAALVYQDVTATTTQIPSMSGTNPTANVMGTISFKQTVPMGQAMM